MKKKLPVQAGEELVLLSKSLSLSLLSKFLFLLIIQQKKSLNNL